MMQFTLSPDVPYPMGLERETAEVAKAFRAKYEGFFRWVQEGEVSPVPEESLPALRSMTEESTPPVLESASSEPEREPWLLENWDIEYFYGLSRPADVSCACPYGWVEKVKRIVDQQYPIFGVERFPDLFAKGAHIAWLVLKNQVFPEYNGGIAVLAILVLLRRNGYRIEPSDEDLIRFISTVRKFIKDIDQDGEEDPAIWQLAEILQGWQ